MLLYKSVSKVMKRCLCCRRVVQRRRHDRAGHGTGGSAADEDGDAESGARGRALVDLGALST